MRKRLGALMLALLLMVQPMGAYGSAVPSDPLGEATVDVEKRVDEMMEGMTVSQKVYQMFIVDPESLTGVTNVTQAGDKTEKALRQYPVGGLIYFSANLKSREQTTKMILNTQGYADQIGMPRLFMSVDEEGGAVARCASKLSTTKFPPMMTLANEGNPQRAYDAYKTIASDIGQFGFNLDFAPVADVITNPDNTEIGNRAFGSDAQTVAKFVEQAVMGLQDNGVMAAVKHFPGHGNTSVNSHDATSTTDRTLDEMRSCELIPFAAGIEAGADMVLVSHLTALGVDDTAPASLNRTIITEVLREELGFDGLVITDGLRMKAISDHYTPKQIARMAVDAGVDILLLPQNFRETAAALIELVKSGEITEQRIDQSVRRILTAKLMRGIEN